MTMEKIEFEFPSDDGDTVEIEVEGSGHLELGEVEKTTEEETTAEETTEEETTEEEEEQEIEIEEVDDTPEADRNRKKSDPPEEVTEAELEGYSAKVKKRISHFSKGYHDERREKEAAQRESAELTSYAQRLVEENKRLKGTVGSNNEALLTQAKRSVAADYKLAKAQYVDAHESGNSEKLLAAQTNLNSAQLRADKLEQIKLPTGQTAPTSVQEEVIESPAPKKNTRASSWAEDNEWFGADDEMTSLALGYHTKMVKSGVDPSSDEYYEKLNSRMREVFPENFEDTEVEPAAPKARKKTVVASASRSKGPKKVTLTRTQVELAKRLGVPIEEYARQVAKEMRNVS